MTIDITGELSAWLAFVGAARWGVGASLGFPVGMSAAADDPQPAALRLSVVSTFGDTALHAARSLDRDVGKSGPS
jgi:hypothetical protein